jgi:DNA polymerase-1
VLDRTRLVFPIQQPAALFHADNEEYWRLRTEMVGDLAWIRTQVESGRFRGSQDIETDYRLVRTSQQVEELFSELDRHERIAVDLETGDLDCKPRLFPEVDCRVIAVGFSWAEGVARALPLFARGTLTAQFWPDTYVRNALIPRLSGFFQAKTIFGQNFLSFDQKWVRHQFGVDYCHVDFDTMLAHYILDEEKGTHDLERLAAVYTSMPAWKKSFNLLDADRLASYLCKDVDATFRIRRVLEPQLSPIQRWLLDELLMPISTILMDAEYRGVRVDWENLKNLDGYLAARITEEESAIAQDQAVRAFEIQRNARFNPAAPHQVADLFENFLHLRCTKRTDSGRFSVDKDVLEAHGENPTVGHISTLRRLEKLHSTYCLGFLEKVGQDGRIHTSYKVHGTVTGRPASENPNLNNLPRESTAARVLEDGSAVKAVFAASYGCCLIEADYSQMELRIMASLSGDSTLIEIFRRGLDAHAATASKTYGVPIENVTKAQREVAKTINFGVIYGMSRKTLIERFVAAGNTEEAANNFYSLHRMTFPGVWDFMDDQERQIRRCGFQETPFGRRRRYSDVTSHAIRQAYNFKIQSWASDFALVAAIRASRLLPEMGLGAKLLMTVYDSLVYDVPLDQFWQTASALKSIMEGIEHPLLVVPLVADMKVGLNWGRMKKIDFEQRRVG